jgi:hypothetical protein
MRSDAIGASCPITAAGQVPQAEICGVLGLGEVSPDNLVVALEDEEAAVLDVGATVGAVAVDLGGSA